MRFFFLYYTEKRGKMKKSKRSNSHFDFAICDNNLSKSKRSQAWGVDLMIALVIFTIGIAFFYVYALNEPSEAEENIESLFYDGKIITDSILAEGHPENWDLNNVITIGILTNNKINETKLESFYTLSKNDYAKTKSLFNTKYNYYFFLSENMTLSFGEVNGIGIEPSNHKNLVKITRFTTYKDKPMAAYLYVWE